MGAGRPSRVIIDPRDLAGLVLPPRKSLPPQIAQAMAQRRPPSPSGPSPGHRTVATVLQPMDTASALQAARERIPDENVICWFVVHGEPVPKARARTTKSGHTYTPERTVEAEKRVAEHFYVAYPRHLPVTCLLGIVARFHCRLNGRGDSSNYLKLVEDGLNGSAWVDDRQLDAIDARRIRHSPNPRTEILVWRL